MQSFLIGIRLSKVLIGLGATLTAECPDETGKNFCGLATKIDIPEIDGSIARWALRDSKIAAA